ncbi:MAG: DMT family transporter [Thiothrix sp.]|uniref:DMT family transporter n=1 Tax=Thiothrix sp. TaxID=1032 RepID=UPI0026215074|nr:DMT family transporter [Thiothrix sp.]MDD5394799.1 DMT family transporter [Thiothrix sp.]
MKLHNLFDLILLAALWGGSFLFMRYAAPEFGAAPLIWLRVAIAAACLMPLLLWRGQGKLLREHAGSIALLGLFSSALPFVLIAWAVLSITSGLASILNATTPIFTALIGALWLGDKLDKSRLLGLAVGFAGVLLLAAGKADFKPGGSGWAIVAMLLATLFYGFATNLTKRHLGNVPPLVNAAGSQFASSVMLLPFAWWFWPAQMPGHMAWLAVMGLGIGCTALAWLLFFRLITRIGASGAVTVTFLIPLFGLFWGGLLLGETVDAGMLVGGSVIILGTALATGILRLPSSATR